jgi:hypothetical protein
VERLKRPSRILEKGERKDKKRKDLYLGNKETKEQ